MNQAFLLIGGNMGNRAQNLKQARELISKRIGTILNSSAVYETAAWGLVNQPDFYNQALAVATPLQPEALMQAILAIETEMGRVRTARYGPRLIDIDILLVDALIYESASLTIPHPRMSQRRFVLAPLNEIAPALVHPVLGQTIQQLADKVADDSLVKKVTGL